MDAKGINNLRTCYELKNRNGLDSTEEFWGMIREYAKDYPNMTESELWQLVLREYWKLYSGFPDMDADINLKHMLRHLKELLKEFENIVQVENILKQKVSEGWKKKVLSEAEEKLSILLESISDVIFEYVGDSFESQNQEDENFAKMAESYIHVLNKVDIPNINIIDYYCNHMIPFYRCLHKKMHEALNENNKDVLRQIAALIVSELIFRIDIMAYCIRE